MLNRPHERGGADEDSTLSRTERLSIVHGIAASQSEAGQRFEFSRVHQGNLHDFTKRDFDGLLLHIRSLPRAGKLSVSVQFLEGDLALSKGLAAVVLADGALQHVLETNVDDVSDDYVDMQVDVHLDETASHSEHGTDEVTGIPPVFHLFDAVLRLTEPELD